MLCQSPTIAYRRPGINPATGNHYSPLSFRQYWKIFKGSNLTRRERLRSMADYYRACPDGLEPVILPCKHCILCARSYRRTWAYRLVAESKTASESMFLTLTVDGENMQHVFPNGSLCHKPFQDFMKRFRSFLSRGYEYQYVPPFTSSSLIGSIPRTVERRFYQRQKIRFYMCGEYGEASMRPHYHACVFGARFPDAFFAKKVGGEVYYSSPTLLKLWPYGRMSLFSDVTPRSAAYVAGYVDKKFERSKDYFSSLGLAPEYVRMSNGISLDFFNEYKDDLYQVDSNGDPFREAFFLGDVPVGAPSYFDEKLRLSDPEYFAKLVSSRESRRLARQRLMPVDEVLNESDRKAAVLLARKKVREIREYA